jgi:hypothetical protein
VRLLRRRSSWSGAEVGVDVAEGVLGPRADQRVTTLALQARPDGLGVELAVDAGEVPKAGRRDRGQRPVLAVWQPQAQVLDDPPDRMLEGRADPRPRHRRGVATLQRR